MFFKRKQKNTMVDAHMRLMQALEDCVDEGFTDEEIVTSIKNMLTLKHVTDKDNIV